jgi:glucan phosphoethanolaminetransferase (alkaline phosphatase superfamily)
MKQLHILKPKQGKEIPFLILISLLTTFITARLIAYFAPNWFLFSLNGARIHHFAYGIILLAITNLILLLQPRSFKTRLKTSLIYGVALGLAFDEFLMWIELEDKYWNRTNADVIIIISLALLNIIYFDEFWKRWGNRLVKLIKIILNLN